LAAASIQSMGCCNAKSGGSVSPVVGSRSMI